MNNSKKISLRTIVEKDKLSAIQMKSTVGGVDYCQSNSECFNGAVCINGIRIAGVEVSARAFDKLIRYHIVMYLINKT
jgi:hypothetical protein